MEQTLMNPDLAALPRLTTSDLRLRYAEVFGEQPPTWNRVWMLKRLAWRLQALAEGGLSERARKRAEELANDADLRLNPPRTTRAGQTCGGTPFTKTSLHRLLANVLYAGKVRYKDEIHNGEQPAVLDGAIFQRVQELLRRNGRTGGAPVRNQFGAILKGLLRCVPCSCAMTPAHTTKGAKRYRYYTCVNAQKRGWQVCPSKSIPAAEIETLVLEQIRCIGRDPTLLHETLTQARQQEDTRMVELDAERRMLERDPTPWRMN